MRFVRFPLFFILFFQLSQLSAQHTNVWYFGFGLGVDFNTDPPTPLTNSPMQQDQGSASFCDSSGKLLFYTTGEIIWNSNHEVQATGLKGTHHATQGALVLPDPGKVNKWLLFTGNDSYGPRYGLNYYSIIRTGNSYEVSMATNLLNGTIVSEHLCSTSDGSGGYWVITHGRGDNKFYAYHLTSLGVSGPVISSIGHSYSYYDGTLKANNCSNMIAATFFESRIVEVYNFNNSTGVVSGIVRTKSDLISHPFGLEFSPGGEYLYYTEPNEQGLSQLNIITGTTTRVFPGYNFGQLQQGPDGKIYMSNLKPFPKVLAAIKYPNNPGIACGFNPSEIIFDTRDGNKNIYTGLPNYEKSLIKSPQINLPNNSYICSGTPEEFSVSSLTSVVSTEWDFGDGSSLVNTLNPSHIYSSSGTYNVQVSITDYCNNTYARSLTIHTSEVKTPSAILSCNGESEIMLKSNGVDPDKEKYVWYDKAYGGNVYGYGEEVIINSRNSNLVNKFWVETAYSVSKSSGKNVVVGPRPEEFQGSIDDKDYDSIFFHVFADKISLKSFDLYPVGAPEVLGDVTFDLEIKNPSSNVVYARHYNFTNIVGGAPLTISANVDLVKGKYYTIHLKNVQGYSHWYANQLIEPVVLEGVFAHVGRPGSAYINNFILDYENYKITPQCSNRIEVVRDCDFSDNLPIVRTHPTKNITGVNAWLGGQIINEGGTPITERGVCWSTSPNPSINENVILAQKDAGAFNVIIGGLSPNTNYYYKSYAVNAAGISYGREEMFTTNELSSLPVIKTIPVTEISGTSVITGVEILDKGGFEILEKGICYSYSSSGYPTIEANKITDASESMVFSTQVTGLTGETSYHIRAYAVYSSGVVYGPVIYFITKPASPTVLTKSISDLNPGYVYVTGSLVSLNGSGYVLYKGICYSTEPNPTIDGARMYSNKSGLGDYSVSVNPLTPNTTYFVRAFVTTEYGTGYGEQLTFTTPQFGPPIVETGVVSKISTTSAICSGRTISSGYLSVNQGICWSVDAEPTLDDNTAYNNSLPQFSCTLSGLLSNTVYHLRAFSYNNIDTTYGEEITFTTRSTLSVPILTTSFNDIKATKATVIGVVEDFGGAPLSGLGFCYSTSPNPTTSSNKIYVISSLENFTQVLNNLLPNTVYYLKVFGINSAGTAYGNEVTFITSSPTVPEITTSAATDISFTSVLVKGNLIYNGGESITEKGICWSLSPDPTINDFKTGNIVPITFTGYLSGLALGTTYYARTYAINSIGVVYGNEVSFTTKSDMFPLVETHNVFNIRESSIYCKGQITNKDGYSPLLDMGFCLGTTPQPTIADMKIGETVAYKGFYKFINGLNPNTIYYIRSYATNAMGTTYGNQICFKTLSIIDPVITITSPVTQPSFDQALISASIEDLGDYGINEKGVCWNVSPDPVISDNKVSEGSDPGNFTSEINDLQPNTTYYLRVYVVNEFGITYGEVVSITTPTVSPTLSTTTALTEITRRGAKSGGVITSDGGSSVIERGLCWSTSPNPTTADNKTSDGSGIGTFESILSGLIPGTTYYLRAYAVNSAGTSYGPEVSFTTNAVSAPVLSLTSPVIDITFEAATSGGEIYDDGGETIIAKGVCWSTSSNPTIADNKTIDGSGAGSFVSSVTSLLPNTTYYVRAYATNSIGTSYGNEITFSTVLSGGISYALKNKLSVYPNPCNGIVTLEIRNMASDNIGIKIYNSNGMEVYSETHVNQLVTSNHRIDISSCGKGIYLIEVITNSGRILEKLNME